MDILDFVNSNGTLCTIVGSFITALISAIVAIVIDNRKSKVDSVRTLKKELAETKQKLEDTQQRLLETQAIVDNYTRIEKEEMSINKSTGSIYVETLPDGNTRNICGYCWEGKRAKMPLTMSRYFDDELHRYAKQGYCYSCNANCYDN